ILWFLVHVGPFRTRRHLGCGGRLDAEAGPVDGPAICFPAEDHRLDPRTHHRCSGDRAYPLTRLTKGSSSPAMSTSTREQLLAEVQILRERLTTMERAEAERRQREEAFGQS